MRTPNVTQTDNSSSNGQAGADQQTTASPIGVNATQHNTWQWVGLFTGDDSAGAVHESAAEGQVHQEDNLSAALGSETVCPGAVVRVRVRVRALAHERE
jgi:hypothetical protein